MDAARAFAWDLTGFLYDHPEALPHAIALLLQLDVEGKSRAVEAVATAISRYGTDEAMLQLIDALGRLRDSHGRHGAIQALGQPKARTEQQPTRSWNSHGTFGLISAPIESNRVVQSIVDVIGKRIGSDPDRRDPVVAGLFGVLAYNPQSPVATECLLRYAMDKKYRHRPVGQFARQSALQFWNPTAVELARTLAFKPSDGQDQSRAAGVLWCHGTEQDRAAMLEIIRDREAPDGAVEAVLEGGMAAGIPAATVRDPAALVPLVDAAYEIALGNRGTRARASGLRVVSAHLRALPEPDRARYMQRFRATALDKGQPAALRMTALNGLTNGERFDARRDLLSDLARDREQPLRLRVMAFEQFVTDGRLQDADAVRALVAELRKDTDWSEFERYGKRYGFE